MSTVTKTSGGLLQGLTATDDVTVEKSKTGTGIGSDNGPVPDANNGGLTLGLTMVLLSFIPPEMGTDFEARLSEVTDKLKAATTESEKNRFNNEMETKKLNLEENAQRMEDAQTKMDEAESKGEIGDIFNKIGIAFQLLGAVIMAALGAALIATGVGGPAGAMMIVGAALLVVSAINSITAAATEDGLGIAGSIAKATGSSSEEAGKADMGFGISLAIVSIAVAIASTVVTAGAAGPALVGAVQNALSIASTVTSSTAAVSSAVSSGVGAGAAADSKEATEMQAKGKETEAFMQQLDDLIDQALTMLMAANDRFNAIMDSVTEMVQDTGNTLSNTRFAG